MAKGVILLLLVGSYSATDFVKFTFSGEAVCCTVELHVAVCGWVKAQNVGNAHNLYLI